MEFEVTPEELNTSCWSTEQSLKKIRIYNEQILGTLQHQQDTKSLHQELIWTVEDNSGGQLKVSCTS